MNEVVPTTDYLVDIENKQLDNLKVSFQDNIDSYDKIIQELYHYNQYQQHEYYNTDKNEILDFDDKYNPNEREKLFDLMDSNSNIQKKLIEILDKESNTLGKTYNKSADMYRNQRLINNVVEEEIDVLESRIVPVNENISNDKRQIQINNYYYKKNKAQTNILIVFILTCFILFCIQFLNHKMPIIFNDTIYVTCTGIILAIFVIYFVYSYIDILSRDPHVFDEYNINNQPQTEHTSIMMDKEEEEEETDYSICNVE